MKKAFFFVFPMALITAFSTASAFKLAGTVTDESGAPVSGALIKLLAKGDSTQTDKDGKFTIQEDQTSLPSGSFKPGHISISDGVLRFSQSSNAPVQVSIFDVMGNRVLRQDLLGSGQVDLRQGVTAQGTYFAKVRVGSAIETVRFTANGSRFSATADATYDKRGHKALLKPGDGDTLRVIASGFDTLKVAIPNLDTTVTLKLKKASSVTPGEQTYAFGYAMGNAPTPSKGCGKDNTLKDNFKFTSAGIEHEIYLTMPENYDKNKPYRLVFGMHYMGGSAKNVATREAYYGLRNQSGAKENTIFVAPHGYTTETDRSGKETENPWRCGDDKDHIFFDEFLTYLNENLCVDTSRVFSVGFSFGAMFSNALAQDFQHRLRGVVVFATMDQVIYLPKNKGLPIAWMGTVGMGDELCTPKLGRSARDRILKNNGKPDADGNFTDARGEEAEEYSGGKHVCYDYKTVDPRFPVKWCTFDGKHAYNASDDGKVWTTPTAWEFITQF
ncbi:T9SS type A sorting domain-containing protein [Fibrobacter sp.]|uniref:carboxypeptidase regulatory-like domain-containing protein n=1 Tax=Fibrobacter sp. TaxID=35828 RepID=UPI0025C53100|nr:T9SS type A sorting domain-containing protein [Fibrobacter sp.]MBR3071774.1 T9SS type A sorting domain-containing protein [Fibrobacter sp.]